MIYVLAVIAGIVGAVVGWFVTGAVTASIAALYGMSDFEGGRAMFAFLGVAPIGGLISMIASAWIVLRIGTGRAPVGRTLARLGLVIGAIALLVSAGILVRLYTVDVYTNTLPPSLEFEIRVPVDMQVPDPSALHVELHTSKNVGDGQLTGGWSAAGTGHLVIAGSVPLALKTSSRLLVVSMPNQPTRLFRLALSRDPASTAAPGQWQRPDHIYVEGEDQPRAAAADDPVEMRYRVYRAGDD